MQLRKISSLSLLFLTAAGNQSLWAESYVKQKKLQYTEDTQGIEVQEEEFEVVLELDNDDVLGVVFLNDVLTGASPTGIPNDQTITGASTASTIQNNNSEHRGRGQSFNEFRDARKSLKVSYAQKLESNQTVSYLMNYSRENDYTSSGMGVGFTQELNQKNTTLSASFARNSDVVHPTNQDLKLKKIAQDYTFNATQILTQRMFVNFGMHYSTSQGYLSDPYKQVLVGAIAEEDDRPDTRSTLAWTAEIRWKALENFSFGGRYRSYADSWKIQSDTIQLSMLQEFGEEFLFTYFYRSYVQSGAFFWQESFDFGYSKEYKTSDIRLSPFHALTLGATAIYRMSDEWWFETSYSRYAQHENAKTPFIGVFEGEEILAANVFTLAAQFRF